MKYNYGLIFGKKRREGVENNELLDRLNMGIKLYSSKLIDYIICSGGIGYKNIDEKESESKKMKEYLIIQGINSKDIIIEEKSKESLGNLVFSIELIEAQNINDLYLISNDHHIPRILQYCKYLGTDIEKYIGIGVHSQNTTSEKLGSNRELVENRSINWTNLIFKGCNSLESLKTRLLSYYFSYNPDSLLTKDPVQAYHRGDIEINEIEKVLEQMK